MGGDRVFDLWGGAEKLSTEFGDFDSKLLGLKISGDEGLFDTEIVGEAELEDGYDGVRELELLLLNFSASTA